MSEVVSKMFVRLSKLRPRSVEWAWEGLVPRGKLTLLTGDPGVGKSLTALHVAAMVTRGVTTMIPVPDPKGASAVVGGSGPAGRTPTPSGATGTGASQQRGGRRGVLIFSAADQPEDTVLPRLLAAGADVSQVFFFNGQMVDDPLEQLDGIGTNLDELDDIPQTTVRPFRLSRDLAEVSWCLEELCDEGIDVGLIVIDSIDRYIGTDEKKSARIEVVAQLADLAARSGVAILVTANTSMKAGSRGGTVVYQELMNTARSVLKVAEDAQHPERRLLLPVKHNLTAPPLGASFTVEQGIVRWKMESFTAAEASGRAQSGWTASSPFTADDVHELDRATRWLNNVLQGGPVASEDIQRQAAQVDISYGTLRRASKSLDCKVRKQKNQWFWSLPDPIEAAPVPAKPMEPADVEPVQVTPVRGDDSVPVRRFRNDEIELDLLEFLSSEDESAMGAETTERVLVG